LERRTYTVTEAACLLGISRTSAYELVRAGTLPALRLGRRIVIARRVLEELLGGPPAAAGMTPADARGGDAQLVVGPRGSIA
jgi:excisionase family DNA binding protein